MKEPAENEKVTEAAMTRSIIASVIGIVLCMTCLFGTTWAWYSSSVTSGVSVTEGANFDFSVEITESVNATESVDATEGSVDAKEGVYTFEGGEHTVTLKKEGTAEKGFCKVVATKSDKEAESTSTITYYIVDFTNGTSSFTVKGSGTLELIPMLGTPAGENNSLLENGIVELTLDTVDAMLLPQGEPPTDETGSPTDGETGTSEGITTEGGQTPPDAEETPPDEPLTNSEPPDETTPEPESTEPPMETSTPEP